MDGIIDLLEKIFSSQWVAFGIGTGGVALFFAACLIIALNTGDFIKNRRAARIIAAGDIENGLKILKSFAPAYDKSREISPPESAFNYDKIFGFPYSYSLIKKLPSVTLAGTAFFTAFACGASIVLNWNFLENAAVMLIFVPFVGFALYIAAFVISGKVLKNTVSGYHAMTGYIRDINVRPATEVTAEDEFVPEKVIEICAKIRDIAVKGGANHETLNRLYSEIIAEKEKYPDGEAGERLSAALDVLGALIDSAL